MFVEVLLAEEPMAANGQGVIAGENDQGVVDSAARVECGDYASELLVEELD